LIYLHNLYLFSNAIFEALSGVKQKADDQVLQNTQLLDNESYFDRMMMPLVIDSFQTRQKIKLRGGDYGPRRL
jgi:type I restriction enzyme R subunit